MSFGLSAGDIAAAIKIIIDAAQVLDEASGAAADYCKVSNFLHSLIATLKTLETFSGIPAAASISLSSKIKEIQEPVIEFLSVIEKYKAKLELPSSEAQKLQTQIGSQLQLLDTALLQVITTSVLNLPTQLRGIFEETVDTRLSRMNSMDATLQETIVPTIKNIVTEQKAQEHREELLVLFLKIKQDELSYRLNNLELNQLRNNGLQLQIIEAIRNFDNVEISHSSPEQRLVSSPFSLLTLLKNGS